MAKKKRPSGGSGSAAAAGGGIGASGGRRLPMMAADHVPGHTFASSTMPRGRRRMAAPNVYDIAPGVGDGDADDLTPNRSTSMQPKKRLAAAKQQVATGAGDSDADDMTGNRSTSMQGKGKKMQAPNRSPNASAYRTPDDEMQGTGYHLQAAVPTRTRELAAAKKGMGFKAAAAAAAKSAGVSPQQGAAIVAASARKASPKARAANPNLAKVAKKGQKKGPGGKFS